MLKQLLLLTTILVSFADCHVRMTFPPARKFALDFLDNVRTPAPCGGMIRDPGLVTKLEVGTNITFTWHNAYPHLGGIRLELLKNNTVIRNLTEGDYIYLNDTTATTHMLQLEAEDVCEECVIRLIKQAGEWTFPTDPRGYLFWSCADVKIILKNDTCFNGSCLNGGTCSGDGVCNCPTTYKGDRCQYKNDCEDDTQCNSGGACVDIQATSYPRKVCFCNRGKMGRYCARDSPQITPELTDTSGYYHVALMANTEYQFHLYWKLIGTNKDEIEVAVRVATKTWVAVGWRPASTTATCYNFPVLTGGNITPQPEGETTGRKKRSYSQSFDIFSQSQSEKFTRREKRQTEVNTIKELCLAGNVSGALAYGRKIFNEAVGPGPTQPPIDPGVTPAPEGAPGRAAAPEGEPTSEPEGEGSGGNLHPMDCQDIIFIAADGNRHRILDSYTRDRSTPRVDEFYGGQDDLTAAAAVIKDGVLHAIFRRKLVSTDKADHTLKDETTTFIWARGQDPVRFYHNPLSGLENCKASDYDYYRINELKYHGTKSTQRGTASLNVYNDPDATSDSGSFRHPSNCQGNACMYTADWVYRKDIDRVQFTISAKVTLGQWAAIGFSDDATMLNTDAVIGWIDTAGGQPTITDRYITARSPAGVAMDSAQDVTTISGNHANGYLTFVFTRSRDTGDTASDIALTKPLFFEYAWGGGVTGNDLSRHSERVVSTSRITIGNGSAKVLLSTMLVWSCILFSLMISRFPW